MAFLGNPNDLSNRLNIGAAAAKPAATRPPSPGKPNAFQRAWEDYRNNTGNGTFPVALPLEVIMEGYAQLLRDLPDLDTTARRRAAQQAAGGSPDDLDDDYYGDEDYYYGDEGLDA